MSNIVQFLPEKNLFIQTLTKDINVRDCIFDLLDNAVDSYVRHKIKEKRTIELKIDKSKFFLKDTCGGISIKLLTEEVFRFGSAHIEKKSPTIGMYGIGLKRSIFKLGKKIVFETDDGKNYCRLDINVNKWINEDKWTQELDEESKSRLKKNEKPYTKIEITDLNEDAEESFTSFFLNELAEDISIYYSKFIEGNKIDFCVNHNKIEPYEIKITAQRGMYTKKSDTYKGVKITIFCWIEETKEKRREMSKASRGWNVYMNDRLILIDNTSDETGWSGEKTELPKFHNLFYPFRGLVFLTSNSPLKLPINTMKNGFDRENNTYVHVRKKMIEIAKPFISYISRKLRKQKREIDTQEEEIDNRLDQTKFLKNTNKISINKIKKDVSFNPPKINEKEDFFTIITYKKPLKQVDLLKKQYAIESNSKLGEKTFDICYRQEGLDK